MRVTPAVTVDTSNVLWLTVLVVMIQPLYSSPLEPFGDPVRACKSADDVEFQYGIFDIFKST